MTIEEFIDAFADQFDDTPRERFTAETVFKDLGEWDSLNALSVIAMVDEEMEKRITGADIRSCNTIQELFLLAKSQ